MGNGNIRWQLVTFPTKAIAGSSPPKWYEFARNYLFTSARPGPPSGPPYNDEMKLLALLLGGATLMCAQTDFDQLVDRYFDDQFRLEPSSGTAAGIHQYDSQLEDYSAKANQERIAVDRKYLAEFEKVAPSPDRDIVIARIHGDLLSLESIRPWQKNPDYYSSSVTSSIFGLISRKFAPPADRLKSVIAREKLIPQVFVEARLLLKNPPKIYTEIATEQLPGNQSFFANDVPLAFKDVTDQALLAEFKTVNQQVIDSLKSYETFLKTDLLAKSHGDYRIGAENFRKKLAYDEMIDIPLDRLLKIGYDNLHANQRALVEVAKQIDATKTPRQVSEELSRDHPAPDQLLQSFRDTFTSLIAFINTNHIITIPSDVRPILEESPPFMRAVTTASMDTPGPYEKSPQKLTSTSRFPKKAGAPLKYRTIWPRSTKAPSSAPPSTRPTRGTTSSCCGSKRYSQKFES